MSTSSGWLCGGEMGEDESLSAGQVTETGRPHFLALDSLRGICACCVALSHFGSDGAIYNSILIRKAPLFVDFFFVLSGYVIMASYGGRLRRGFSIARFMTLRVGRIYPLHICILFAWLLIVFILPFAAHASQFHSSQQHSLSLLLKTIFLVQIFFSSAGNDWNAPSWSIAAEIWTYLIFAISCRSFGRYLAIGSLLLIATAPLLSPDYVFTIRTGAVPRCVYGFYIGVLGQMAWARWGPMLIDVKPWIATICEISSVVLAMTFAWLGSPTQTYFLCPWAFLLVILSLTLNKGLLNEFMMQRWLVLLGTLSYSIYMDHEFVEGRVINLLAIAHVRLNAAGGNPKFALVTRQTPFPHASDLVTILTLLATIAVAYLTYRVIESPGRRWSRRLAR